MTVTLQQSPIVLAFGELDQAQRVLAGGKGGAVDTPRGRRTPPSVSRLPHRHGSKRNSWKFLATFGHF